MSDGEDVISAVSMGIDCDTQVKSESVKWGRFRASLSPVAHLTVLETWNAFKNTGDEHRLKKKNEIRWEQDS